MGGRERRTGLSHGARHGTAKYNTCVRCPCRPWRFWHGSLRLSRHDQTVLDAMDLWPIRAHPETVDPLEARHTCGKIVLEESAPWAKELPLSTSHSNRSLRTEVSVAGKRNLQGGDKEAEMALEIQGRRRRDKISLGNPADAGLIAGCANSLVTGN